MPDDASAADEPATLAGRVTSALESGDLDAIRDLNPARVGPGLMAERMHHRRAAC